MTSLESYLRNDYLADKRQLEHTLEVIKLVLPIFGDQFMVDVVGVRTWPYRLQNGAPRPIESFSDSTHCMILFALKAILESIKPSTLNPSAEPVLFPSRVRVPRLSTYDLDSVVNRATSDVTKLFQRRRRRLVSSKTYGIDDPLTLTWWAELLLRSTSNDIPKERRRRDRAHDVAREVCRRRTGLLKFDPNDSPPRHEEIPHAFLRLRLRHLAKVAARLRRPDDQPLNTPQIELKTFEDELHRQLGYFSVPDSRFDPAVLVFALEGALQFDPHALSDNTIESFFQTIEESQKRNPYWRPVTPFLANSQGMVLFPVSVEISNSLLRTYEILTAAGRPAHSSRLEGLLRRYAQWLLARAERSSYIERKVGQKPVPRQALGWHSEHVNEPGTIHMWETSQVLLFLVHYSSLLQRKIAAEGLLYAGLKPRHWKSIDRVPDYWSSEPLDALARVGERGGIADEGDAHYAVLRKVHEKFVVSTESRSLLLYGPPGTGKTTVAEQMAVGLERPMLTITVSDFLASGDAEVESRAKGIFLILEEQEDIVILFDEIDQFLLDRNSKRYRAQSGVFQFLTPGMLTKFQDLRDKGQCTFLMATNYEERIDGAIKRQGRFDERLMLSLPDAERRRAFIWLFLRRKLKGHRKLIADATGRDAFDAVSETAELIAKTALFGFGDLQHLVKNRLTVHDRDTWQRLSQKLVKASDSVQPSVRLNAYVTRFDPAEPDEQKPFEEFALLLYLIAQTGRPFSIQDKEMITRAFGLATADSIVRHVQGSGRVKRVVAKTLSAALL
jgi:adenylate kinase family enzyme